MPSSAFCGLSCKPQKLEGWKPIEYLDSDKASLPEVSSVPHSRKRQHKQVQPLAPNETLSDRDFHEMCLALAIIAEHIHARTKEQEAGEETHANV